jgi:predicted DNA-binding transcriptional regulator AlpA
MSTSESVVDYVRSRQETAKRLGVSLSTLARLEKQGKAPPRVKISDRCVGYSDSAIAAFIRQRTNFINH